MDELTDIATSISNGAFVSLLGQWVPSHGGQQRSELQVAKVLMVGEGNTPENPIQKKAMTKAFLRAIPHLRIRTDFQSLLLRTRSMLISSIHTHFSETHQSNLPVYLVHPPLITSSDCEGAGEVFTVEPQNRKPISPASIESGGADELYFRDPKYLTVSSQLHLEAFCAELGAVYAFSPTFRAEESDTPRHLAEFYMVEAEFRNTPLQQIMGSVKTLIKSVTAHIAGHANGQELLEYYVDKKHGIATEGAVDLQLRWAKLLGEWESIDYTTAIRLLQEANDARGGKLFDHRPVWAHGLHLEHERWLTDTLANNRPVFVTDYPKVVKPFYMLPSTLSTENGNAELSDVPQETMACFDLLLPFGYCEVVGGSLREHRLPDLIANMREKGLLKKVEPGTEERYPFLQPDESLGSLKWYGDLRRFGSSPHGGYGLGFDRLLAYLTGVANVRDVVSFPRVWGKADC
ncbi:uncharacterized protein A1O9_00062 [Exophiala aquamarina CBS 119918]|uniref:Aminoacyl-transfer RNA synthetases class-II family profile domain-containing protein n=1 Tax=Exophiala aquamarina CBS 119918 TaxID=1182545 RepID=A0A072Q2F9_9EURO|nr:uncharacterized protein A1O9_00062 [Exophiala aquamarina CBS 119918]KEF62090.1 hypothetical protein A1O9_00062 [Exophiala aquamarina CBS 119918]